jgi:hypothetical protein
MNDLKQIIRISKISDIWEKEIDSKINIDWTAIYDWNISDILDIDENIKNKIININ